MSVIADNSARLAALDPLRSFCVAAPAGSGKTELLIQRYLVLLARVSRPEQVVTITFTRKAAAEMQERVIQALQAAQDGHPVDGEHEQVTRNLANAVLSIDTRLGWQLLRDHSRFTIKTIDSFCASLSRQLPILSGLGGRAGGQDDVGEYYEEAVRELFSHLDVDGPAADDLKAVLQSFDNNWERLAQLLTAMLARRSQWHSYIEVNRDPLATEKYLVSAVDALVSAELNALNNMLKTHRDELLALLQYAAKNQSKDLPVDFPGSSAADIEAWRKLRELFLTASDSWRARVDKRQGFPAGDATAAQWKARWATQREALEAVEGLEEMLALLAILPVMTKGSESWQLVLHLSRLLPLLAAELLLVFERHGVVDHTQVAQSALLALGEDDEVTDLALRLDYHIEHILVDEFQDTAVTQYDLLQKLTRGWYEHNAANPDAPRTLMIVGDPMQSIYAFRGANVGLFLNARQQGFNGVVPEYLQLECNFRSDRGVVHWVNETFRGAFPQKNDALASQVKYSPATAVRPDGLSPAVDIHGFRGDGSLEAEVAHICDYIERHACAEQTVAVLGRGRSHLQPVINELKRRRIDHYAQDMDSLAASSVVSDLMQLCRALASDADRLAWLSLLRAPWCALSLKDLLQVAHFSDTSPYTPVWQSLLDGECRQGLSDRGRQSLNHILPALAFARQKQDRLGLRVLVEQTWEKMGGRECVERGAELADVEQFMQLLEQAEAEGVGLQIPWLERRLEKQFMSGGDADAPVQLMTLHKAKGLEFPRVVIPQLGKSTRGNDRDLLRWEEHADVSGAHHFLLAADDGSKPGEASLYNYLGYLQTKKGLLENTRLIYVGVTRACHHVLLTAQLAWDDKADAPKEPVKASLLHTIWPTFARQMQVHVTEQPVDGKHTASGRPLVRLLREGEAEVFRSAPPAIVSLNPQDSVDNHVERSIGTVVHRALELLSQRRPLPAVPNDDERKLWRYELQGLGLFGDSLSQALDRVDRSVSLTLSSPAGRWVLAERHDQVQNEWAVASVQPDGSIANLIIDRAFVDLTTDCHWIIDYKNSQPQDGESLDLFYAREMKKYDQQLRDYSRAVQGISSRTVYRALFFTALGNLQPFDNAPVPAEIGV